MPVKPDSRFATCRPEVAAPDGTPARSRPAPDRPPAAGTPAGTA